MTKLDQRYAAWTDDVVGGDKNLKSRKHDNVQAGTGQTGAPV